VLPLANCGDDEEEGRLGVPVEVPQFRRDELRESQSEKSELDNGNEGPTENRQENEGKKILSEHSNSEYAEAAGAYSGGLRPLSHPDAQEAALAETLLQPISIRCPFRSPRILTKRNGASGKVVRS
jgi:hypothetical protein